MFVENLKRYLEKRGKKIFKEVAVDKSERILDIGCGQGLLTGYLYEKTNAHIVGLDLSEKSVETAGKNNPDCEFRVGKVEDMPFEDNSFNIVIGNAILHHLEDPYEIIPQVKRVLKENGFFIAVEMNRINPLMFVLGVMKKTERKSLSFSQEKYTKALEKESFIVKKIPVNSYIYPFHGFPKGFMRKILVILEDIFELPLISTHYLIIARKKR